MGPLKGGEGLFSPSMKDIAYSALDSKKRNRKLTLTSREKNVNLDLFVCFNSMISFIIVFN